MGYTGTEHYLKRPRLCCRFRGFGGRNIRHHILLDNKIMPNTHVKRQREEDDNEASPSRLSKRTREDKSLSPRREKKCTASAREREEKGLSSQSEENCTASAVKQVRISPLDALRLDESISDSDWHAAVAQLAQDTCANYKQTAAVRPPRETSGGFFVKNLAGGAGPPVQVKMKKGLKIIPRVTLTFFARVLLPSKVLCAATTMREVKLNQTALPRFVYKAAEKLRVGGVRYVAFGASFASSKRHTFDVGDASRLECVVSLQSYSHDSDDVLEKRKACQL
ncbi:hypothetical protein BDZ88DRAFT_298140 [Geranomyces variabilis]|nr:hypothetical protein BDZ88DRAFT_298140 [Geranomyces variabilis]KAJ3134015.1 hypothetical protein HDU90_005363 [Geranomyces variabilis]